jgi:hypothetical protein
MDSNLKIEQNVSLQIVKKPVKCSKCGEPRTQVSRCENCGCEKSFTEEQNEASTKNV